MTTTNHDRPVRRRVIYHGRVQGVFFRATSVDISRRFDVVGFARNLPDGTVELEAEGPQPRVEAFLAAVARHFEKNITRTHVAELSPHGDETAFTIRY